ncbi:DUF3592 domain-containing protein [Streptomyces marinisediminis]|uniref:DUF3592 domain-containing protein n=1 Tax=Streptomyces TaxID=1883 RepID=UPI002248F68F|nr:hypothetical protein [Streptomyces sp. JHD 1]
MNLTWTSNGLVLSVIDYQDAANVRRSTQSAPGKVIDYPIGQSVDVFYDPQAKVKAVVAEQGASRWEYLLAFILASFGLTILGSSVNAMFIL